MKPTPYFVFRQFLRSQGCEEAFDRSFEIAHPGYILDAGLSELIGIDCGILGRVFRWDSTPEGREYWKKVDDQWNHYIE